MTPRWSVRIVILGDRYAVDLERRAETVRRARLSTHTTRAEAEAARAVVRRDPAAHWREPGKRGPRSQRVRWSVEQRRVPSGRIVVSLRRYEQGERTRSCVVRRVDTTVAADKLRAEIRRDPAAYWREPAPEPERQLESKRRAAAARVERQRLDTATSAPTRLDDGRWELGCGLHSAARRLTRCPACDRAHAETIEALGSDRLAAYLRDLARRERAVTRRVEVYGSASGPKSYVGKASNN
jgi:hypothetical protein